MKRKTKCCHVWRLFERSSRSVFTQCTKCGTTKWQAFKRLTKGKKKG